MSKKFVLSALLILIVLTLAACSSQDVVATVNGEKITVTELDQRVEEAKAILERQGLDFSGEQGQAYMETLRKQVLDGMINDKLLLQEARKSGELNRERRQEIISDFKTNVASEEEFKRLLDENNLSEEELAYLLYYQELVAQEVAPPSEEEVRQYFDENQDMFTHPDQLEVRHILFFVDDGSNGYPVQRTDEEAKRLAEEVIAQLAQGQDFAALAVEKSEDEGTKIKGGLYRFSPEQAVLEFSEAASQLAPGEYTQAPVKTQFGYHVILMEREIPAGLYAFEDIKDDLAAQLNDQAVNALFNDRIQELKDKAEITNTLETKEEDTPAAEDTPTEKKAE